MKHKVIKCKIHNIYYVYTIQYTYIVQTRDILFSPTKLNRPHHITDTRVSAQSSTDSHIAISKQSAYWFMKIVISLLLKNYFVIDTYLEPRIV